MPVYCAHSLDDSQEVFNLSRPTCRSMIKVDYLSTMTPTEVAALVQGILNQHHNTLDALERHLMYSCTHTGEPIEKKVENMVVVAQHARNTHKLLDQFAIQVLEDVVPMTVVLGRQKDRATTLKVVLISHCQTLFHSSQLDSGKLTARSNLATPDSAAHGRSSHNYDNHPTVRTNHADCQPQNQEHTHTSTQRNLGSDATAGTGQRSPGSLAHSCTVGIVQFAGIARAGIAKARFFFLQLCPGVCTAFQYLVPFWTAAQKLKAFNREAGGCKRPSRTLTEEEIEAIHDVMAGMSAYLEPDWEFVHSDEVLETLTDIYLEGRLDAVLKSGVFTDAESE